MQNIFDFGVKRDIALWDSVTLNIMLIHILIFDVLRPFPHHQQIRLSAE